VNRRTSYDLMSPGRSDVGHYWQPVQEISGAKVTTIIQPTYQLV